MPINVPGLLLSKILVEREDLPEERGARLRVIGGLSDFPAGLVLLESMVPRRAADSTEMHTSLTQICEALEEARDYDEDQARGELIAALEQVLRELLSSQS